MRKGNGNRRENVRNGERKAAKAQYVAKGKEGGMK
jgi:hypothetical protein